jgi:uncharacterized protein
LAGLNDAAIFLLNSLYIKQLKMEEIRIYTEKERNWAMFCHISSFARFIVPFGGLIGPLICWSSKRSESDFVDYNGKSSLNFQLSILLYVLMCVPLMFIVIGFVFLAAIMVLNLVCVIIAGVKASRGEYYRYPLSIPFIQ